MMRNVEIPENKVQTKKQNSVYPKEFIDKQLDILLGLIASRIPVIGEVIVENLFSTPQFKEILRQSLIEYYQDMHSYCFQATKSVVRSTLTKEDFPLSYETVREIVESLEKEYGKDIPELSVEPEMVLAPYIKNQKEWLNSRFRFSED